MAKCIPIKKPLIEKIYDSFPNFEFEGANGSLYSFVRRDSDGLYEHIIIQRDFYENKGALVITEVAVCYNRNWRGIPWFTVGMGTDIAVLITGKRVYPAQTGWRYFENTKEGLTSALEQITDDIQKYIVPYFVSCHIELAQDKIMKTVNDYTMRLFPQLSKDEVISFKSYLKSTSIAYSQWRKERKKQNLTFTRRKMMRNILPKNLKMLFLKNVLTKLECRFNFHSLKRVGEKE